MTYQRTKKSADPITQIHIKGAREHNLKNLELFIPHRKLTVITGVSGSGKSSLAFDTLYAEGYRKYIDSLSAHARQLLEQVKRPEVDYIQGLSPVIAIEQRSGRGSNPRTTVATATEIADYARMLWALKGVDCCPLDGGHIQKRTIDDCVDRICQEPIGSKLLIVAHMIKAKAALIREEIPRLRQRGFLRIRLNGTIHEIDRVDPPIPTGGKEIQLDIIVDRLVLKIQETSRVADSLELAFREGNNKATILVQHPGQDTWQELVLSQQLSCITCNALYDPLSPRHFSHNHVEGACSACDGLGYTLQFTEELIVLDPTKSVSEGALKAWRIGSKSMIIRYNAILKQLAAQMPFDAKMPWCDLPKSVKHFLLYGSQDRTFNLKGKKGVLKSQEIAFEGVIPSLQRLLREVKSDNLKARLMVFQTSAQCTQCSGLRLNPRSLAVKVENISFAAFMSMDIQQANVFMKEWIDSKKPYQSITDVLNGICGRLKFLEQVGLEYLTLNREYATLSGGEAQRVRLASQLGMGLIGVLYILDEPSIGLHPQDNERLIKTLLELRDRGNTVVVVEHDEETMLNADHLIELGPCAGVKGGSIVFQGTPQICIQKAKTSTAGYLSGRVQLYKAVQTLEAADNYITVHEAQEFNLKKITVQFPIGLLTCVCGVSGSGKSTLVNDILGNAAALKLNRAKTIPGLHKSIEGFDHFESIIRVNQDPIGRTVRSNPATYVKLFDLFRELYAECSLSRVRGYKANRFSFNLRGGRCERCQGEGAIWLDMLFLGEVHTECPSCHGKRYNRETLEVKFRGYTISDVLGLTIAEAMEVFKHHPRIINKLNTLHAVGLGYLKLGQSADTLSGGEAQRLKLSLELSRRQQGKTLYILDEPTTGLHWEDIQKLIELLFRLRDAGNTIIIIEHHIDVIRLADWIVELGPEGGHKGGNLIYQGPAHKLIKLQQSPTAKALNHHMQLVRQHKKLKPI